MPFNISDYANQKNHDNENRKCKHCKQQSNNHISLKMAFVVLMLKTQSTSRHSIALSSLAPHDCNQSLSHTNIVVGSAPIVKSKMKSSLFMPKWANRREPTQNNCSYWFQTHKCAWWEARVYGKPQKKAGTHFALWAGGRRGACDEAVTDTTLKRCGILLSDGQDVLCTMECTTVHVFAG